MRTAGTARHWKATWRWQGVKLLEKAEQQRSLIQGPNVINNQINLGDASRGHLCTVESVSKRARRHEVTCVHWEESLDAEKGKKTHQNECNEGYQKHTSFSRTQYLRDAVRPEQTDKHAGFENIPFSSPKIRTQAEPDWGLSASNTKNPICCVGEPPVNMFLVKSRDFCIEEIAIQRNKEEGSRGFDCVTEPLLHDYIATCRWVNRQPH